MLYLFGINHKTADLGTREKLWLSDEDIRAFLPSMKKELFRECFLVSTCNRTEFYGVPQITDTYFTDDEIYGNIEQSLVNTARPGAVFLPENFYRMKNMTAARHLIEVATGLDSMILGDVQILNQIRQHYQLASGLHTNGPILNKLLHVAIHAGKRSKSETEITKGSVSVSYAAVELAAKIYYNLNEKTALLIGAGETGELTAKHLINRGIHKLFITNRTSQKASELAAIMNATAIPYEEYPQQLLYSDIVITSVNSPEYIITTNQFSSIFAKQNHSPILMIDIGVPRNIDPELNTFENVFLHDMDSLSAIVEESLRNRHECIPEVNQIVAEELEEFSRWCRSHSVVPIVDELRLVFENIRNEELNYHIHKFREEDKELIEHLTRRIVYRLVEMPARELRNGETESQQQTELKISLLKKLFGLNEKSSEEADKI